MDVEYPRPHDDVEVPDQVLAVIVRELRKNLEYAVTLERELGIYELSDISPILQGEGSGDPYRRTHGLSGSVISFSSEFERLSKLDIYAAQRELAAWPTDDDMVFARLRIWVSGLPEVTSGSAAGSITISLTDKAFWNLRHQRDLLLALAKRWSDLPENARQDIEERLRQGPPRWAGEEEDEFEERRAMQTLDRLNWLAANECSFSFDLAAETRSLKEKAAEWKPDYAAKAAESLEARGGYVITNTEYSLLLRQPLDSILSRAAELGESREDCLVQKDPFAGLSRDHPIRAFAALVNAAKRGEFPEWAWRTFLNADARKSNKQRLSLYIAQRISSYPSKEVAGFIHPASDWLLKATNTKSLRA